MIFHRIFFSMLTALALTVVIEAALAFAFGVRTHCAACKPHHESPAERGFDARDFLPVARVLLLVSGAAGDRRRTRGGTDLSNDPAPEAAAVSAFFFAQSGFLLHRVGDPENDKINNRERSL